MEALPYPMVQLRLFKDSTFVGAAICVIVSNIFLLGVTVLLPNFLTKIQLQSEMQAAILVTPISGMIFVVAPIMGAVVKKVGHFVPVLIGFVVMGASYFLLSDLQPDISKEHIILLCSLLGTGFGILVGPSTVAGHPISVAKY
jgi:hypothetical protein